MKLIVGLGNPGSRYSDTRHNAGRSLAEWIADKKKISFKTQKKLKASVAHAVLESEETLLAFPETYMNVSGEAVVSLIKHFQIDAARDLLVLVDDVAIPFGKFRLRGKGSDGGHNGLKSIAGLLQTSDFARLRIGIGAELKSAESVLEAYVLSAFEKSEKKALPGLYERGYEACLAWITQPIAKAMNAVNGCQ